MTGAILAAWGVTFALRAAPFVASRWLRDNELVEEFGLLLPVGVMATLVVAMLQDTPIVNYAWVPTVIATAATIGIHLLRKSVLLSIVTGVAVYGLSLALL
ncbi:AzlD domain-containing protein [Gulosibacter bifidus]|uniref:AzlD domain-containing protein n=1 Tax=Gulosibacter bifidus TaxID=272239 RepID=A0ABW5RKW5_9MICO|nr:AzlD domain-containing protein [Gulosibacter bifidus]